MPENQSGEKTEQPTPRRREKAREEGQVSRSQELNSAFTLMGSFLILYIFFSNIIQSLGLKMTQFLTLDGIPLLDAGNSFTLVMDSFYFIARLVAPVMVAAAVIGAVISFIQVGALFSVKAIKPKFKNISPLSGLKNIVSMKSVFQLFKSLFKAVVITILAFLELRQEGNRLITLSKEGLQPALVYIGHLIFRIGINIIIFLIVLGVADYFYQRWEHMKNLKMTKREVREERKEMEGDPLIRSRRREQQRQFSLNRMMSAMEEADVVITNPTHIAVALKFEIETMDAPVLLAKGEGYVAERIREKARELEIEIVENKPLARSLNESTELGEKIPVDLYQAAAEVLAFVYRNSNRRG